MKEMKTVAQMVLSHRKAAGLSQKDLADMAGVGKTTIFDIEKEKDSVRFCNLLKVLNCLNIEMTLISPLQESNS